MRTDFYESIKSCTYVPQICHVSIHEAGSHHHDFNHEQGCGLSGAAPVTLKFHICVKRISAIAANTMREVEYFYLVECSVITSANTYATAY